MRECVFRNTCALRGDGAYATINANQIFLKGVARYEICDCTN